MSIFRKTVDNAGSLLSKAQTSIAAISLEEEKKNKEHAAARAISQLNSEKDVVYAKIGKAYYEMKSQGNVDENALSEHFTGIEEIDARISEQEKELEEFHKKVAEEAARLKAAHGHPNQAACPKCGKEFVIGTDLFCAQCGENLKDIKPPEAPKCPNCAAEYNPDSAKFCRQCGTKLTEDGDVL